MKIEKTHFFEAYPQEDLAKHQILAFRSKGITVLRDKNQLLKKDCIPSLSCQLFYLQNLVKNESNINDKTRLRKIASQIFLENQPKTSPVRRMISAFLNFLSGYGLHSNVGMWKKIESDAGPQSGTQKPLFIPSKPTEATSPAETKEEPSDSTEEASPGSKGAELKPIEKETEVSFFKPAEGSSEPLTENPKAHEDSVDVIPIYTTFDEVSEEKALEFFQSCLEKNNCSQLFVPFNSLSLGIPLGFEKNFRYVMQHATSDDIKKIHTELKVYETIFNCPKDKLRLIFTALSPEQLFALLESDFNQSDGMETDLLVNYLKGISFRSDEKEKEILFIKLATVVQASKSLEKYRGVILNGSSYAIPEALQAFCQAFVQRALQSPDADKWRLLGFLLGDILPLLSGCSDATFLNKALEQLDAKSKEGVVEWANELDAAVDQAIENHNDEALVKLAQDNFSTALFGLPKNIADPKALVQWVQTNKPDFFPGLYTTVPSELKESTSLVLKILRYEE